MPIICGQIHIDLFEAALFCLVFLKKKVVVRPIYHEIPSLTKGNTYLYLLPQNKAFHEQCPCSKPFSNLQCPPLNYFPIWKQNLMSLDIISGSTVYEYFFFSHQITASEINLLFTLTFQRGRWAMGCEYRHKWCNSISRMYSGPCSTRYSNPFGQILLWKEYCQYMPLKL